MRGNDTGLCTAGVPVRNDVAFNSDEAQHLERMHRYLVAAVTAAGGWIAFERFMDLALYAPGLGYYSAGARKLGPGGDFITAPELSPLFGACVARQCAEVFQAVGNKSILEAGAGTGKLAVDVLRRLETLAAVPERYSILEVSADLRERQQARIRAEVPRLADRVVWLDSPPSAAFDGVIIANEVLDALPVVRFRWHARGCEELGVGLVDGELTGSARPGSASLSAACERLSVAGGGWDDGYVSEYCPRLAPWTCAVVQALRRGVVLWFDYGLPRPQYYLPERHDGTLMCHFRQRAFDDPLRYPGLQDISAWVDFTALAEACLAAGFELGGFTTQAYYLAGLGIDREMQLLAAADTAEFARLAQQARQLMLPGEMGERFKAMAWTRGLDLALSGFALQDLRHSL